MGSTRRVVTAMTAVAALGAAMLGVTGAVAQSDDDAQTTGAHPAALLERLDALEQALPDDMPPTDAALDPESTWGTFSGDAGSVRAVLDTLQSDLRRLFVDADDADGPVADAVALVARGWLDVWNGTATLAVYESSDLAFPIATVDDDDVATGADDLRGRAETGLEMILLGRSRHLEGYTALRQLGEAEPAAQARLDGRAAAVETFDSDVRPLVVAMLSQPTTSVLVPTDRFETTAPGVEARAKAFSVTCVDREALDAANDATSDPGALDQIGEVERVDCPAFGDGIASRADR